MAYSISANGGARIRSKKHLGFGKTQTGRLPGFPRNGLISVGIGFHPRPWESLVRTVSATHLIRGRTRVTAPAVLSEKPKRFDIPLPLLAPREQRPRGNMVDGTRIPTCRI